MSRPPPLLLLIVASILLPPGIEGQIAAPFDRGPSEFLPPFLKEARRRQDPGYEQSYPFRPPLPSAFPQPALMGQYAPSRGEQPPYPFQNGFPPVQGPPQVYPGQGAYPQPQYPANQNPQPGYPENDRPAPYPGVPTPSQSSYPGGPPAAYPQPGYTQPTLPPPAYETLPPVRPTTYYFTTTERAPFFTTRPPIQTTVTPPARTTQQTTVTERNPPTLTTPPPIRTTERTQPPAVTTPRSTTPQRITTPPPTPSREPSTQRTTPRPATTTRRAETTPQRPATTTPATTGQTPATTTRRTPATTRATTTRRTPATTRATTTRRTPATTRATTTRRTPATTTRPRPAVTTPIGTDEPLSRSTPFRFTTRPQVFTTRPPAPRTTTELEVQFTTRTTEKPIPVPNRIWGKPHVICEETGILFTAITFFPFAGEIFARQRQQDPNCSQRYNGNSKDISLRLDYKQCGTPIQGARPGEAMYSVEIVVNYDATAAGPSYVQQFLARCENQRIHYETEDIPRRVEEALEELNLIPEKIERKAPIPGCFMRVVPESPEDAHTYGKSNASEVSATNIGQKLRIEFGLEPPSEAYGFLVRNCTVRDNISGREYLVLDQNGCSTDINILQHPHYDTYNDIAIVHWHAFKVPDDALLSIKCGFQICSEIKDNDGRTSCEEIPTPPFCPNLVTGPSNSILTDFDQNFFAARRRSSEFQVQADVCIAGEAGNDCAAEKGEVVREGGGGGRSLCLSGGAFGGLLASSLLSFLFSLGVFLACRRSGRRKRSAEEAQSYTPSPSTSSWTLYSQPRVIP